MNPLDYIHSESVRQSATVAEMAGMANAYVYMSANKREITQDFIIHISWMITGQGYYRQQPVYFRDGGHAMNWAGVPRAMESLIPFMQTVYKEGGLSVDTAIKEFLLIHPFLDGNGRVASLLRNYLLGTLSDPTPLPYYFGEN